MVVAGFACVRLRPAASETLKNRGLNVATK